jgi:O-antigen/teichoic acid export membrane protein
MSLIKKQTFQSTIYSYLSVVIGFVTQGILIPNFFSTTENGLLLLLMSLMVLLPLLSNLGFNGAGNMLFPHFRNSKNTHNGYLFLALSVSFFGFCLLVLALFFFKDYVVTNYEKQSSLFVQYYYYLIPLSGIMLVFNVFDVYARLNYD